MWRAVERVTSSTGLCLPAGFAPWSEPTGRSGASCDGILWLGELWGCTITGSTFPSPLTLLGVVFVGQGTGGGGTVLGLGAAPRGECSHPRGHRILKYHTKERRLFLSLLIALFGAERWCS